MESLPLQQLADETLQALVNANASKNYQKVFKTVSRNFIVYAREHDIDSFSIDHGIQFLEDHYSMSQKMAEKKWNGVYLRCINAMYGDCRYVSCFHTEKILFSGSIQR